MTHILIDRGNRRISLAYEIGVDSNYDDSVERQESLTGLLSFILDRIVKLDEERRYAVHYAPMLSPFAATVASFNFHCGEYLLDYDLPRVRLDDFTVPGASTKSIKGQTPGFSPDELAQKLIALCNEAKE